jgi:hypothetical protein
MAPGGADLSSFTRDRLAYNVGQIEARARLQHPHARPGLRQVAVAQLPGSRPRVRVCRA